MILTTVTE